jgi:hypothetical protein
MKSDNSQPEWRKSSRSDSVGNQCVEVALLWEPPPLKS